MKPSKVADIMVRNLITCKASDTLAQARQLMKDGQVRHVPVLDEQGQLVGLVTQRAILRETLLIASRFGIADLEYQEQKKLVSEIMEDDLKTIPSDMSLLEAGRYFTKCKQGCLPVVDAGQLVGIITSADFVKLSISLLED